MDRRKWLLFLLKIILALLFFMAAVSKLKEPAAFAQNIENYKIFGGVLSRWIAVWVPFLEILLGLLLISGRWTAEALLLTLLLYLVFDAMILQAFLRGLDVTCGCFGNTHQTPIGGLKILENTILTLLAVSAFILYRKQVKKGGLSGPPYNTVL
ncbi:MAG: MauE/DoxX family redox-associated membrane protein [Calditrichia bacterium]